jgi:hypothetical protein
MRFKVSTAVEIEILVFWVMIPCGFVKGSREMETKLYGVITQRAAITVIQWQYKIVPVNPFSSFLMPTSKKLEKKEGHFDI